jgi:hypothetical protein
MRPTLVAALALVVAAGAAAQPKPEPGAYLGVRLTAFGRAQVVEVVSASPAERAGVRAGDVITQFDGVPELPDEQRLSGAEVIRRIAAKKPGEEVTMTLDRGARRSRSRSAWHPTPIPSSDGPPVGRWVSSAPNQMACCQLPFFGVRPAAGGSTGEPPAAGRTPAQCGSNGARFLSTP